MEDVIDACIYAAHASQYKAHNPNEGEEHVPFYEVHEHFVDHCDDEVGDPPPGDSPPLQPHHP